MHSIILMSELLIKPVIKVWSCYWQWQKFCWLRWRQACLSWLGTAQGEKTLKAISAFHSLWDALYPFLMQSCLKEDHVKCQELPQCVLGNNFWSLSKWLVTNSALISVVFITLVAIRCGILCLFYREGTKLTALYMSHAR